MTKKQKTGNTLCNPPAFHKADNMADVTTTRLLIFGRSSWCLMCLLLSALLGLFVGQWKLTCTDVYSPFDLRLRCWFGGRVGLLLCRGGNSSQCLVCLLLAASLGRFIVWKNQYVGCIDTTSKFLPQGIGCVTHGQDRCSLEYKLHQHSNLHLRCC